MHTNAPPLFNADGDIVGWMLPASDPATVRIVWSKHFRHGEETEDYVYRAEWRDGTWAESATEVAAWRPVMWATSSADLEAARDRHALQQHSNINHEAA